MAFPVYDQYRLNAKCLQASSANAHSYEHSLVTDIILDPQLQTMAPILRSDAATVLVLSMARG